MESISLPQTPTIEHLGFTPFRLLRALSGYALLGLGAALGSPELPLQTGLEAALLPVAGAGILTVPAMLVAHQTLALKASPTAMLRALTRSLMDVGDLGLALGPVVALFLLTTDITPLVFAFLYLGLGVLALGMSVLRLLRAEREADGSLGATVGIGALALGWATLAGLIALRLLVPPLFALL